MSIGAGATAAVSATNIEIAEQLERWLNPGGPMDEGLRANLERWAKHLRAAPAVSQPVAWWNGITKELEAKDKDCNWSISRVEDTNHDIPLVSTPNPCIAVPESLAYIEIGEGYLDVGTHLSDETLKRVLGPGKHHLTTWPPFYTHPPAPAERTEPVARPDEEIAFDHWQAQFPDMHVATRCLVWNFALSLGNKLAAAEKKYGYADNWRNKDWEKDCQAKLLEHVGKGDPRDVAAYCAFMWAHGWKTTPAPSTQWREPLEALCRREDVQEVGPWKAGCSADRITHSATHWVDSDDFTHDVRLYITGDFGDWDAKTAYAEEIAKRLNAAAPPTTWREPLEALGETMQRAINHVEHFNPDGDGNVAIAYVEQWHRQLRAVINKLGAQRGEG
jgi:hypothetical protein